MSLFDLFSCLMTSD